MTMPWHAGTGSGGRSKHGQLLVAGAGVIVLESLFLVLYHFNNLERHVVGSISVGLAAGIVYFAALYALEHSRAHRAAVWIVIAGALLFRLTLLPLKPSLSNDPYRYHWDGVAQLAGYNPYLVSPDKLAIGMRITPNGHRLPAHQIPNIYPPLAELAFRAAARLFPSTVAFKLPFFLSDVLSVFLLAACLWRYAKREFRLAVYAWNPLVIFEFSGTGHSDALAIVAVLAAILIVRQRIVTSTLALAAATLLKVFPIMLFPLWLRRAGWPRTWKSWAAAAGSAALALACFWPYRAAFWQIPKTMRYFVHYWQNNNASLWAVLRAFSGMPAWASGIGEGTVVGIALWAAARRLEPERAAYLIFGAILLFTPNAYPWYFTWMIPFLCFYFDPAWLLLTVLQFLAYNPVIGYQGTGKWHWSHLMILLEYAPFYVWFAWGIMRGKVRLAAPLPPHTPKANHLVRNLY